MGYHGLARLGYAHQRAASGRPRPGDDPAELRPRAPDRLAGQAWLLSTHQVVEEAHLQSYLDEFVFRFNRRRSQPRLVFYRCYSLATILRYRTSRPPAAIPHPPQPSAEPSVRQPSAVEGR